MTDSSTWIKQSSSAPVGFFDTEAAGLRWLADAGALPVVDVRSVNDSSLTLTRLTPGSPSESAARAFGVGLARLHNTPAEHFGQLPPGAQTYFFGPLDSPIALPSKAHQHFGTFYAQDRLEPLISRCSADGSLNARDQRLLHSVCEALRQSDISGGPSRVHGDLWSGNVMWTPEGATLIDPAACGHHPLADLAMLTMFGCPYLDAVLDGYAATRPLAADWRESLGLHQLFGYLVHVHLFGPTYLPSTLEAARSAASRLGV